MTAPTRGRRRPARKRRPARPRWHRVPNVVWVLGAAAVLLLVIAVQQWGKHHPAGIAGIEVAMGVGVVAFMARGLRLARRMVREAHDNGHTIADFDAMGDVAFEYALADLAVAHGCTDVRRVGGAGDLGADVKGKLPGRRWWQLWLPRRRTFVIQAKRYQVGNNVGSGDVQKVGGTWKVIHGADLAIVVTTSQFTRAALDYCQRAGIRTCNRTELAAWASRTGPAPWQ